MTEKLVKITNKTGLHARPATDFVKEAKKYKSNIFVEFNGKKADGKSVLGILTLGVSQGSLIKIYAEGEDEEKAVKALMDLINSFEN